LNLVNIEARQPGLAAMVVSVNSPIVDFDRTVKPFLSYQWCWSILGEVGC